jgi:hypothetical protein
VSQKLKDGTTNRYVYYGCTKFRDKDCPCGYIREEDLIEQLATVLDIISLDEIGMKDRIRTEIESHNEFQESVLGKEVKEKIDKRLEERKKRLEKIQEKEQGRENEQDVHERE